MAANERPPGISLLKHIEGFMRCLIFLCQHISSSSLETRVNHLCVSNNFVFMKKLEANVFSVILTGSLIVSVLKVSAQLHANSHVLSMFINLYLKRSN